VTIARQAAIGRPSLAAVALAGPLAWLAPVPAAGFAGGASSGAAYPSFGLGYALPALLAGLALVWALRCAPPAAKERVAVAAGAAGAAGAALGVVVGPVPYVDAAIAVIGIALGALLAGAVRRPLWLIATPPLLLALLLAYLIGVASRDGAHPLLAAGVGALALALVGLGALLERGARRLAGDAMVRFLGGWTAAAMLLVAGFGLLAPTSGPPLGSVAAGFEVERTELTPAELRELLADLLAGVYGAFEEESEDGIYDALAAVADTDLVSELYLQNRRALVMRSADGAQVQVLDLALDEMTSTPLADRAGYRIAAAWRVAGAIGHWGHTHERVNRYAASLTLAPVDGRWKLAHFDLRDVQRQETDGLGDAE